MCNFERSTGNLFAFYAPDLIVEHARSSRKVGRKRAFFFQFKVFLGCSSENYSTPVDPPFVWMLF